MTGEVVSVEEEEVLLDLRSFSQGVIPSGEYSGGNGVPLCGRA